MSLIDRLIRKEKKDLRSDAKWIILWWKEAKWVVPVDAQ